MPSAIVNKNNHLFTFSPICTHGKEFILAYQNCRLIKCGPTRQGWNSLLSPIDVKPQSIPNTHPPLNYFSATPAAAPIARLVILHGYGDHAGRHSHVMQWFAQRGIACYAVDFRGHGRSGGKPGFIRRWDEYLHDLAQFLAIDELASTGTPLFILGHSHGGLITVAAAQQGMLNRFAGAVLVAPYLALKMPVPLRKRMIAAVASHLYPSIAIKSGLNGGMLTRDQAMIALGTGDPYTRGIATPRWFTQTRKAQLLARANPQQFKLPLLMLLPGADTVADTRASEQFYNQCNSPDKTILHYPENRHELLRELDRERAFADILSWFETRIR